MKRQDEEVDTSIVGLKRVQENESTAGTLRIFICLSARIRIPRRNNVIQKKCNVIQI